MFSERDEFQRMIHSCSGVFRRATTRVYGRQFLESRRNLRRLRYNPVRQVSGNLFHSDVCGRRLALTFADQCAAFHASLTDLLLQCPREEYYGLRDDPFLTRTSSTDEG